MNTVFVDTTAFYAVLDRDDANHPKAREAWLRLLQRDKLLTSNYVLVETAALVQHRLGMAAHCVLSRATSSLFCKWTGLPSRVTVQPWRPYWLRGRKELSLVDCVSFQTMREWGVRSFFCFDVHFREQGFESIP